MSYRMAGIDVHKKMLAVAVSNVEVESEYQFERRMFGSSPDQLRSLAEWLLKQTFPTSALRLPASRVAVSSTVPMFPKPVSNTGLSIPNRFLDPSFVRSEASRSFAVSLSPWCVLFWTRFPFQTKPNQ